MKTFFRLGLVVLLMGLASASASGQTKPRDLAFVSLEELMQVEVTSVSRREQHADDIAAAVYVVTRGDIRRSGLRTLAEVLRLVPGVQVARINGSQWAVSIRGFNTLFANNLLVLIDGRSVYNRAFSGVFWESQDVLVDDIERIEVVRGPGGAVWGANAVNGVINIVTRHAGDTQGLLVRASAGTFDRAQMAVRYGGTIRGVGYRVSTQWSDHGRSLLETRAPAKDNWNSLANAFRADWTRGKNAIIVEGNLFSNTSRPLWLTLSSPTPGAGPTTDGTSSTRQTAVLARWTHTRPSGSSLQVQSFFTHGRVRNVKVSHREQVADVDVQYETKVGTRHEVVTGGGVRQSDFAANGSFSTSFDLAANRSQVSSLFAQDEISVAKHVRVSLGSKLEHESMTGWSVQPTVRAMWDMSSRQHVWFAASRAIRTPSAVDRGIRVNFAAIQAPQGMPIVVGLIGNPSYKPEQFVDAEIGYRVRIRKRAAFDITAFRGRYRHLQTNEPMAPIFEATPAPAHLFIATRFDNLLDVETTGIEIVGHWAPADWWRVEGSYSGLKLVPRPSAVSRDEGAASVDGNAPSRQWQLRSDVSLGSRLDLGAALYHTGPLRKLAIPAYTRADARIKFEVTDDLSLVATGQNLLKGAHAEFGDGDGVLPTLVPRSATLHLVWRF